MNERIRELAEQAMSATFNKFSGVEWSAEEWRNFYDTKFAELRHFYDTKFAELIVKECIGIAQDRANFPGYPPNDVNHIIDEIKEHFGVEL
jgi:hypothetical protein